MVVTPATKNTQEAFFASSYVGGDDKRKIVSFYGDNHPYYAGSVVKAMASAKHGFKHVAALYPEVPRAPRRRSGDARRGGAASFFDKMDELLHASVVEVNRLTSTIVEVVVKAPLAARKFKPGQFYRLQNFESYAPVIEGTRLSMEGLALTGAWIDEEKGLLGTIVLEMGGSSRLCAALRPGEPIILMGPTGTPTEIHGNETVMLVGGGLGNAVLFSIARAMKALGSKVLYFAGYKKGEDLFKQDDIERYTDQVIWVHGQRAPRSRRAARRIGTTIRGNIVQAIAGVRRRASSGNASMKLSKVEAHHRDRLGPHDGGGASSARHTVLAAEAPEPAPPRDRQHQLADAVHDERGLRAVPPEAPRSSKHRQGDAGVQLLTTRTRSSTAGRLPAPATTASARTRCRRRSRRRGSSTCSCTTRASSASDRQPAVNVRPIIRFVDPTEAVRRREAMGRRRRRLRDRLCRAWRPIGRPRVRPLDAIEHHRRGTVIASLPFTFTRLVPAAMASTRDPVFDAQRRRCS